MNAHTFLASPVKVAAHFLARCTALGMVQPARHSCLAALLLVLALAAVPSSRADSKVSCDLKSGVPALQAALKSEANEEEVMDILSGLTSCALADAAVPYFVGLGNVVAEMASSPLLNASSKSGHCSTLVGLQQLQGVMGGKSIALDAQELVAVAALHEWESSHALHHSALALPLRGFLLPFDSSWQGIVMSFSTSSSTQPDWVLVLMPSLTAREAGAIPEPECTPSWPGWQLAVDLHRQQLLQEGKTYTKNSAGRGCIVGKELHGPGEAAAAARALMATSRAAVKAEHGLLLTPPERSLLEGSSNMQQRDASRQLYIDPSVSQGVRNILVVRTRHSDQTDTSPLVVTHAYLKDSMDWVVQNIPRTSMGAITASYTLVPTVYALPTTASTCSNARLEETNIIAALGSQGYTSSNYKHFIFAHPGCNGWFWVGISSKPGRMVSLNGVNGAFRGTIIHELGHNWGFSHSSGYESFTGESAGLQRQEGGGEVA